jgi:hypothetical protein
MCAFQVTSGATEEYNCISWALHHQRQAIWPDGDEQFGWPEAVPRQETIEAFRQFFGMVGFLACPTGALEIGREKIAIHARGGLVSHTARQLPNGEWTSKLGALADGSHPIDEFNDKYGPIVLFMNRPAGPPPILPPLHPPPARLITPGGGVLIR